MTTGTGAGGGRHGAAVGAAGVVGATGVVGPRTSPDAAGEIAGAGAAAQASRLAELVEEARRDVLVAQRRLEQREAQQRAWAAGAEGERRTAAALLALPPTWGVLHDVRWPGRLRANLDHVVVGPGGVVVVDSKAWSSDAAVRDGVLRCGSWLKTREAESAAAQAAAVAALLEPAHRRHVRGAVSLVRQDLAPALTTSGATAVGAGQLVAWLVGLPPVLGEAEVVAVHGHLRGLLAAPTSPLQLSTAALVADRPGVPARSRGPARRTSGPRASAAPAARPPASRSGARTARRRRRGPADVARLVAMGLALLTAPQWAPPVAEAVGSYLAGQVVRATEVPRPTTLVPATPVAPAPVLP